MVDRKEIIQLFKKPKFREHSIYFYKETKTVSEVKELSGISRSTIYNHFSVFKDGEYYDKDYLRTFGGGKEAPYKFTHKILVDWLSGIGELSRKETQWLEKSLENEKVESHLRGETEDSWSSLLTILAYSWGMMLFYNEKEKLGATEEISEALEKGRDFEESEKKEILTSFKDIDGFTNMWGKTNLFRSPVKKNPEMAKRVFGKLKKAEYPLEQNPFRISEENVNAMRMMWDGPFNEIADQFINNEEP